jgi:cell division protein FtsI (penicillin-binding protein 3)
MGQEIAVTPIQLVTMASSIANGGVYLPPHIVLESTPEMKGSASLKATAFRPGDELPNPLPAGAHRVISEMTSAQMRKMMEGVVLFGTGRPAQLDGYSAGGKTGTAQKIDPKTHTYSKTKYVASFVGFAPVNNPAVTIAVIMDSPTKGSYFGTAVSAPVFHDLAQQILEYLGVPHDQDLKPENALARNSKPAQQEAAPQENAEALASLFAEVNHLPADDPLRNPLPDSAELGAQSSEPGVPEPGTGTSQQAADNPAEHPALESGATTLAKSEPPAPPSASTPMPTPNGRNRSVAVPNQRVSVPSFAGKSLREVVVQASDVGLGVQVVGSGIARDQAPAAGTLVPAGAEIVVRFAQ